MAYVDFLSRNTVLEDRKSPIGITKSNKLDRDYRQLVAGRAAIYRDEFRNGELTEDIQ